MADHKFYIVDVFAQQKYAGNQLAVVLNASGLTDAEMQQIAREFDFSETTFITADSPQDDAWPVRIFTPQHELPFAGHPTLGTAYIIRQHLSNGQLTEVTLAVPAGRIPVAFEFADGEPTRLTMTQLPPSFGRELDRAEVARVLGLKPDDLEPRSPVQEVSTGFWTIIAPLVSLEAQDRIRIDRARCEALIEPLDGKDILTYCRQTHDPDCDLNVRMFADYYGVPEDPATGSANGCLAAYLVKHRVLDKNKISLVVEQGVQMGRPSRLCIQADETCGKIVVKVGGSVVPVAQGRLV
ncbi:MAG: PhzF family phenazine biosynthesis protein [bacterium]